MRGGVSAAACCGVGAENIVWLSRKVYAFHPTATEARLGYRLKVGL